MTLPNICNISIILYCDFIVLIILYHAAWQFPSILMSLCIFSYGEGWCLLHLSDSRSACPNPPPDLHPGRSPLCGWGSGMVTGAGRRSLTPSTSTATPNPPCVSTATDCSEGSSGRACSAQVTDRTSYMSSWFRPKSLYLVYSSSSFPCDSNSWY